MQITQAMIGTPALEAALRAAGYIGPGRSVVEVLQSEDGSEVCIVLDDGSRIAFQVSA